LTRKDKCKIESDDENLRSAVTIEVGAAHQTTVENLNANFEDPSHAEIQQPSLFDPKNAEATDALGEVVSGFEEDTHDLTVNPAFAGLTVGGAAFEESAALGKGAGERAPPPAALPPFEVEGVAPPPYTHM
jgi:hypothetical protein